MPGLSASLLEQGPLEALEPSADLFQGATFGLAIPPGTPEGAARVALNLSRSVGAEPFFMDAAEVDNVAATVDAVPALFGAALVRVATRSPSWHEVRRLAGRAFAALCGPVVSGSSESLPTELTLNRETVVPKLDEVLEELRQLRAMIAQGDEAGLADRLRAAHQAYETWIVERRNADWASEGMAAPAVAKVGMAERLFGTRRPRGRTKDKG
jgi:prephenate dehydrogenase